MTTPADASEEYKNQIRTIVGGWRDVQQEVLTVNTASITFTIPPTAKMARIQGVIAGHPSLIISPAITLNNLSTNIYNSLRIDTAGLGDSAPVLVNAGPNIQFTSAFGSGEQSLIDVTVPISNTINRQLFKSVSFNNGGNEGDYHTCVAWAASGVDVSTIELFTVSPFANGLEAGSFFTLSVMELA